MTTSTLTTSTTETAETTETAGTASTVRIVVGTDGSVTANRAFEAALALAAERRAELHVVSAASPSPILATDPAVCPMDADILADAQRAAGEHRDGTLERCEERGLAAGVRIRCHGLVGEPADSILTVAREVDADQIVVGNRGMKGVRGLFPSVPRRVARRATCDVRLVATT